MLAPVHLADGRLVIDAPWEEAIDLKFYLRAQGIHATVHRFPDNPTARIELADGVDRGRLAQVVAQWQDNHPG
jgi:hypothetical protein